MILSNAKNSKYEAPFSIKILDANLNLVTLITYSDLQWDRSYNSVGKFVIQGVVGSTAQFNRNTWKYVYTEKRKEVGVISQVNWKKGKSQTLTLSGYFLEAELNRMICYPKPTVFDDATGTHYGTSILSTDAPTWITAEDTADEVAEQFFEGFKQISFRNFLVGDFTGTGGLVTKTFALDIDFGEVAAGEYHYAIHNRNGEKLGDKLYDILQESGASIEVVIDYEEKTKTLNIIHGVDRTQDGHAAGVNPILFSSKNGTIKQASVVTSDTDTCDAVIQASTDDNTTLVLANCLSDAIGRFTYEDMQSPQSDFINEDTPASTTQDNAHKLSVMGDASTRLNELKDVLNIQFDFAESSYRYMEDFDLGDKISIDIPELDISTDAQIVACHEVIKKGIWSMSFEVGKIIVRKRGTL